MCLAVPLKLIEINGLEGIGERDGIRRKMRLDLIPDPKIGDYVMLPAGFAIERLSADEAEADIAAAREVEEELRKLYAGEGKA